MDNITDIKEKLARKKKVDEDKTDNRSVVAANSTNPILKKLMQFKNADLSKKFDINDLLR